MLLALALLSACASAGPQGSRVVLVTIDGTRWQEIFRGADATLSAGLPPELVRGEAAERRQALLPFLWKTVAAEGQIFGNPERGSRMVVANPWRGSYPGYHELLCGSVSPVIVSNKRIPNPDPTVLHWLERRPGFGGAVAAFASWDVFASILNQGQGGVLVDVGPAPAASAEIDRLAREAPPPWADSVYDAFVFRRALRHLQAREPRVLFVGLGDTDEWAHARRYDRYLQALRRADGWLAELWGELQARPAYRGRTSLVITVDHGRGDGPEGWQTHGADVPGSEVVWAAVLGPGVPARGERAGAAPLTLGQVAATVVRLAGEQPGAFPGAAPVLPLWAAPRTSVDPAAGGERSQDLRLARSQRLEPRGHGGGWAGELDEDLGVAVLRGGERDVELAERGVPLGGEAGRQQREALVRARLDQRGAEEGIEAPLRLVPAHLRQQGARVVVGGVGAQGEPPLLERRRHLHDVAGLLVGQAGQPFGHHRPRVAAQEAERVLGRLALAVQVVREQGAEVPPAGGEPPGRRRRAQERHRYGAASRSCRSTKGRMPPCW